MRKENQQASRQQWETIIKECTDSGKSKREWLKEQGITERQYYYWQKNLAAVQKEGRDLTPVSFVQINHQSEVTDGQPAPAIIRLNDVTIEINDGISDSLLTQLVKVMRNA